MQHDGSYSSIMMDEKISIKDSLRCLKKYGSTSSNNNYNNRVPDHCIKHIVTDDDTLQGLALKYGVTTEQIRRVNRLWANDSLFLRESLLIPSATSTSASFEDSSIESDLFLNQSEDESGIAPLPTNGFRRSDSGRSSASSSRFDGDDPDIGDFLSRIDAEVADKMRRVKKTQDRSTYAPDFSDISRRKPLSRLKQQQLERSLSERGRVYEVPAVSTQRGRIRETREDIFEL